MANSQDVVEYLNGDHEGSLTPVIDRLAVQREGTLRERALYFYLRRQSATGAIARRRELARTYLEARASSRPVVEIDPQVGFACATAADHPVLMSALAEARDFLAAIPPDAVLPNKGTRQFVVSGEEKRSFGANQIGYRSALAALARNELILMPLLRYFAMLPILYAVTVDRAPNDRDIPNSTQQFHLDPEDVTNMKVFIYLDDVAPDGGPFTALPADQSRRVVAALDYRSGRLSDEQVHSVIGAGHEISFAGAAGTMIFCDTDRCLHYGGRRGVSRRDMIMLHYVLPTATYYPWRPGDGEPATAIPRLFSDEAPEIDRLLMGMVI